MGTKEQPGLFDCYSEAEPDEPFFVLLARDPLANILVSIWAQARKGNICDATASFSELCYAAQSLEQRNPHNPAKIDEALNCAADMRRWRISRQYRQPTSK